jgi:Tfp pilus assembly protein PilV
VARRTKIIKQPYRGGYTLAEAMIASVVLAAAVIGLGGLLAASSQQSAARGDTTSGLTLAQQLMEEIASKPIDPPSLPNRPGWSSGQTDRTQYDTIDDYNGYTDLSNSLAMRDGNAIQAGKTNSNNSVTRTVTVTQNALPTGLTGTASDFVLVTVKVTLPEGHTESMSQLFTRATVVR